MSWEMGGHVGWQARLSQEMGEDGSGVRRSVLGREQSVDHKNKETWESGGVFRAGNVCHDMENKSMIDYNQNLGLKLHYGTLRWRE